MKKTLISIFLFLSIFSISLYSYKLILNSFNEIIKQCDELEKNFYSVNFKETPENINLIYSQTLVLSDDINHIYNKLAFFLSHETLDLLKSDVSALIQYIKSDELGECLRFLNSIKSTSETIINLEKITLENIF